MTTRSVGVRAVAVDEESLINGVLRRRARSPPARSAAAATALGRCVAFFAADVLVAFVPAAF
ncbi:MAG: hypothetical protein L0H64_24235, partial [Pseudonocardia sp.]|nr:hypothetical protein [Pseudonocardia sp.]